MLSRRVAAAVAMCGALLVQPAQAGSLSFGLSVQSGGPWVHAWHEPRYLPYRPAPGYYAPALLSPRQIEQSLRRSGYSRLEVVALRGPVYTVQGVDPWHNYVEMQVSGHDGRVLRSDVIEARLDDRPYGAPPPSAAVPDYRPPAAVPDQGPRIVGAVPQPPPPVVSQTEPQVVTAPLPRSRPAYRPPASRPEPMTGEPERVTREPEQVTGEPDAAPSGRDPLVVY